MPDRRAGWPLGHSLSKRSIVKAQRKRGLEGFVDLLIAHSVPDSAWKLSLFTAALVVTTTALFTLQAQFIHGEGLKYDFEHASAAFIVSLPVALFVSFGFLRMARMQSELARLAATDVLTGLANRRAFFELAGGESETRGGVALVLDVDHFKRINDTYGHDVGDQCLKAVADLLRQMTRDSDILGRLGGEEFAVFLVEVPHDQARAIGERLAEGIQLALDELDGKDVRVTVSVGGARSASRAPIGKLLAEADRKMYEAKRAGRARLVMSDELAHEDPPPENLTAA